MKRRQEPKTRAAVQALESTVSQMSEPARQSLLEDDPNREARTALKALRKEISEKPGISLSVEVTRVAARAAVLKHAADSLASISVHRTRH